LVQALLHASIEFPAKFGGRRRGRANTQVVVTRCLQAKGRAQLGAQPFNTVGARSAEGGSIEQCRKIEDILRANQRSAYATYEMTVKLVLQRLITNL